MGGRVLGLAHVAHERIVGPHELGLVHREQRQVERQPEHLGEDGPRAARRLQAQLPVVAEQAADPAQGAPLVHGGAHAVDGGALAVRLAQPLHRERRAPLAAHLVAPALDRRGDAHRRRAKHPGHVAVRVHARLPQPVPPARGRRREHEPLILAHRGEHRPAQPGEAVADLQRRRLGQLQPQRLGAARRDPQAQAVQGHRPLLLRDEAVVAGGGDARAPVLAPSKLHQVHAGPVPPARHRRVGLGLAERGAQEHVQRLRQRVQPHAGGLAARRHHAPRHQVHEDHPLHHPHVLDPHEHLLLEQQVVPARRKERPRPIHHAHALLLLWHLHQRRQPRPRLVPKVQGQDRPRQRHRPVAARVVPVHPRAAHQGRAPVLHQDLRPVDRRHGQHVVGGARARPRQAHPVPARHLHQRRGGSLGQQEGWVRRSGEEHALGRHADGLARHRRPCLGRRLELRPLRRALAPHAHRRAGAPLEVVHRLRHQHDHVGIGRKVHASPGVRVEGCSRVVHGAPQRLQREVLVCEPAVQRAADLRLHTV